MYARLKTHGILDFLGLRQPGTKTDSGQLGAIGESEEFTERHCDTQRGTDRGGRKFRGAIALFCILWSWGGGPDGGPGEGSHVHGHRDTYIISIEAWPGTKAQTRYD
jgi:hypothetical protein